MKPRININLNVNVTVDKLASFIRQLNDLTTLGVAVGFPEEGAPRKAEEAGAATNALIGYVQNYGLGVPQRNFMESGIEAKKEEITDQLAKVATEALDGRPVRDGLSRVGLVAQAAVRGRIGENLPPPLAAGTLRARRKRGRTGTKTLQDTSQMRNAVNFVVMNKDDLTQSQQGRAMADRARTKGYGGGKP